MEADYGLYVWPSSIVLSEFIYQRMRSEIVGKNVVELGCGTSLVGILASKIGANVTLTDKAGSPFLMERIEQSL
jgi:predicted nicotinamide N-methyase